MRTTAGPATGTPGMYCPGMLPWADAIDPLAEQSGFAGVVSVDFVAAVSPLATVVA